MTSAICTRETVGRILFTFFTFAAVSWLFTPTSWSAPQNREDSFAAEFNRARQAEERGEYLEAITRYKHLLSLNPAAAEAYSNLGLDYYRLL